MAYEGGGLCAALEAAVGDDVALVRDLRRAFLESADRRIDLLERAGDETAWQMAMWRLKGLCGSFGVVDLLAMVEAAQDAAPCDPKVAPRLRAALSTLSAD